MRTAFLLLLGLLLALSTPGPAWAQARFELSGLVRDGRTQRPLPFASVFLTNTTYGVTTDADGRFRLPGVPAGPYELTASYLGYKLNSQRIEVRGPASFTLDLQPGGVTLAEVRVRPGKNRGVDFQRFVRQFLGLSALSQQCRIENPDDLVLVYDEKAQELTAIAPGELRVLNPALGYRVTYHRVRLKAFYKTDRLEYTATPVFELLTSPNPRQQRRWEENRRRAYLGSLPHFLRSVYADRVTQEGFVVRRVRREPDSDHARQHLAAIADSLLDVQTPEPGVLVSVYRQPLPTATIRRADNPGGQVWLRLPTEVQVTYPGESPDLVYTSLTAKTRTTMRVESINSGGISRNAPHALVSLTNAEATPETSLLRMLRTEALILPTGYLRNPLSMRVDGYWNYEKAGEALPFDYVPDAVK